MDEKKRGRRPKYKTLDEMLDAQAEARHRYYLKNRQKVIAYQKEYQKTHKRSQEEIERYRIQSAINLLQKNGYTVVEE